MLSEQLHYRRVRLDLRGRSPWEKCTKIAHAALPFGSKRRPVKLGYMMKFAAQLSVEKLPHEKQVHLCPVGQSSQQMVLTNVAPAHISVWYLVGYPKNPSGSGRGHSLNIFGLRQTASAPYATLPTFTPSGVIVRRITATG